MQFTKIKNIKKETKIIFIFLFLIAVFFTAVLVKRNSILKGVSAQELSETEKVYLNEVIKEAGYERNQLVHPLPYKTLPANLNVNAQSAILINCDTGDILFEKNADLKIPPASMTKVFLMYTVFEKIKEGKATLDDVVPLPKECWASSMPVHSSLMFLGKNQTVTLRELMTGLAVCSGNDASHAIAYYLFGSLDAFIEEVNNQIKLCGLTETYIYEPSGYSEQNVTTAREMASFARNYLEKYPESLELFHSVKKFAYPKLKNIAPEDRNKTAQVFNGIFPDSIWSTIEQENTNKLLKTLEGCDGLKTGYIDESGYNLSLTCKRNGMRYLSVTMKGPGNNIIEGDRMRQEDGRTLMDFAFNSFIETRKFSPDEKSVSMPVLAGNRKAVKLFVPYDLETCVPRNLCEGKEVIVKFVLPKILYGDIKAGETCGKANVIIDGMIIEEAPLICDRDVKLSNIFRQIFDKAVYLSLR